MALKLDGNYELIGSLCILCRHRPAGEHQVCAAFPQGIPLAILRDEHDHLFPIPVITAYSSSSALMRRLPHNPNAKWQKLPPDRNFDTIEPLCTI